MNVAFIGVVWFAVSCLVSPLIGRVLSFCARRDELFGDVPMTWTVDGDDFDGEAPSRDHGAKVSRE